MTVRERGLRLYRAYVRMAPFAFAIAIVGFALLRARLPNDGYAFDMHAYWEAARSPAPYAEAMRGGVNAYLYAPAFAQLLWPLGQLPWEAFRVVWTLVLGAALFALAREWAPLLLVLPMVSSELGAGNIHFLLGLVVVAGMARPGLWAFALLTKPTMGVCLLYYIVRREWWKLTEALVVTALVVAVSALLWPAAWGDWGATLVRNAAAEPVPDRLLVVPWPLGLRLAIAAVLSIVAGWKRWPILMPVAALFALPVMWLLGTSMLVAMVPFARPYVRARPTPDATLATAPQGAQ